MRSYSSRANGVRRQRLVRDYDRVVPRLPVDAEASELPVLPGADSVSELRRRLLKNAFDGRLEVGLGANLARAEQEARRLGLHQRAWNPLLRERSMHRLMYSSKTSPKKFVNVFRALPTSELAMIQYMPCVKRSRSNRRLTQTSGPSGN